MSKKQKFPDIAAAAQPAVKRPAPNSARVINFLNFVDTQQHHFAGWYPVWSAPAEHTHFALRGHRKMTRVTAATARVALTFIKPSARPDRMYDLTKAGQRLLAQAAARSAARSAA